jgi:hypothetical protein
MNAQILIPSGSRPKSRNPDSLEKRLSALSAFSTFPWSLQARLQKFSGSEEYGEPIRHKLLPDGKLAFTHAVNLGARFEANLEVSPVEGRPDAFDGVLNIHVAKGSSADFSAALELVIGDWSREHWLLLPAGAYNGNRFHCEPTIHYSPVLPEDSPLLCANPPVHVIDIPRLNDSEGPSRIQFLTGDLTTPAIAFHAPATQTGFILLFEQESMFGNHGVAVEESDDRRTATLRVEAPGVRRGTKFSLSQVKQASPDRGAFWQEGSRVAIRFRLFVFAAPKMQDLFARFLEVRKDLTGPTHLRHLLPFSAAWELLEEKYNRDSWDDQRGRYMVGIHRDVDAGMKSQDWQPGWVGGAMATQALIFSGSALSRERAIRNLDWMLTKTQAASGFFRGMIWKDEVFDDGYQVSRPYAKGWSNVRRNADVLYFLMKQIDLLKKQEASWKLPDAWREALQRLADRFVALFREYGQLGQIIHIETGNIILGGSSGGAMAPAGLALAAARFERPDYLEAAQAIARHYLERDVRHGITTGGPAEILQAPDSESAFAMLESFVVLYEATGAKEWLEAASTMATQCATWVGSYDYRFPETSILGKLDSRTTGTVYASVQNKCHCPGICTLSGDSLFKLFRATGNHLFLELIRDIAHALPQFLSRVDRPVGEMDSGWICERVNCGDWEGFEHIGGAIFGPCWPEVSLMLSWIELPGLYVQTDTGLVATLDHVDAFVESRDGEALIVRLNNPTPFPARIRVLAETSRAASTRLLGSNSLLNAPVLEIPAGGTVCHPFH